MVEKISAVTLRVANMEASVRFYKDVLGLEIIYGGEGSYFTSLRTKDGDTILNLEHGNAGTQGGRFIFQPLPPEHLRLQPKMLRISGKDGPYGKPPKTSVVALSRWLPAPLEAYFALNDRWVSGSRQVQRS